MNTKSKPELNDYTYPYEHEELITSDSEDNQQHALNLSKIDAKEFSCHNRKFSLNLSFPPLGTLILKLP